MARGRYDFGGYDRWGFRPEEEGEDLDTALIRAARRQAYHQAKGGDRTLHLAGRPEREASAELQGLLIAKQGWARPPARRVGGYGGGGIDEETRKKLAGLGRARLPETGQQRAGFDPATMSVSAPLIRAQEEAEAGRTSKEEIARITAGGRTGAELIRGSQARRTALVKGEQERTTEDYKADIKRQDPMTALKLKMKEKEFEKLILEMAAMGDAEGAEDLRATLKDWTDLMIMRMRGFDPGGFEETGRDPNREYLELRERLYGR